MKKILLLTALATASTSSIASNLYLLGEVGGSYTNSLQDEKEDEEGTKAKLDHKSAITPQLGLAFGGYIGDNFRAEVALSHDFSSKRKLDITVPTTGQEMSNSGKLTGYNAMVRGLADVVDTGYGKLFAGVGLGAKYMSMKVQGDAQHAIKFAYQGILGASYEISEGVNMELKYQFTNYSKGKLTNKIDQDDFKNIPVQNQHNIVLGLRYDI